MSWFGSARRARAQWGGHPPASATIRRAPCTNWETGGELHRTAPVRGGCSECIWACERSNMIIHRRLCGSSEKDRPVHNRPAVCMYVCIYIYIYIYIHTWYNNMSYLYMMLCYIVRYSCHSYIWLYLYTYIHPVSITRFPSFRTQPLAMKKRFLSNPAPGENLVNGNLVMETGCRTRREACWRRRSTAASRSEIPASSLRFDGTCHQIV